MLGIIGLVPPALVGAEDLFVLPGLRSGGKVIGLVYPALLVAEGLSALPGFRLGVLAVLAPLALFQAED